VKPQFQHDCDKCDFLGRVVHTTALHPDFMPPDEDYAELFALGTAKVVDLYLCKKGSWTVIARYSDDGPDYVSGLQFADGNPDLKIAKRMAQAKGLLPK